MQQFISPFIDSQFPDFYKQEGPNFIAFIKAYYEWLESDDNTIGHGRKLLDYRDIDKTKEEFIEYFKRQFVFNLPENVAVDKTLLIKYITDLYKSKGTKRAYELLFRLIFNEEIELYIPSEFVFKPSDNTWYVPRYIEVTSDPKLELLAGREIKNISNTASGIVESYNRKIIEGRTVNILELSNIRGDFRYGDQILTTKNDLLDTNRLPTITGSLTAIAISDGGFGFNVGDILTADGSGISGKVRVTTVSSDFRGAVQFAIVNGGSGYTLNSIVTVSTTLNLPVTGLVGNFLTGERVLDSLSSANGLIVQANTSAIQLIDFDEANNFSPGMTLIGQDSGASATVLRVIGGAGQGATFRVGSITNRELLVINNEVISPYLSLSLDNTANTFQVNIANVSGSFTVGDTVTNQANVAVLEAISISPTFASAGEVFANASLGISGLYCYRADQTLFWVTGSDADLLNANLVTGSILISNVSNSVIQLFSRPTKEQVLSTGIIQQSNSTSLRISSNGYFVESTTLVNSNTAATARIVNNIRLTDWNFANSTVTIDNLDSVISDVTPLSIVEVGKIDSLAAVNPGSGYLSSLFVSVVEPLIIASNILNTDGTTKGNNAIISATVTAGNGVVKTVEVIDSGFGYQDNETLILSNDTNQVSVLGSSIVFSTGKGEGRWLNRKSFPSDLMKIYDGIFYQDYAYEIITAKMLNSYESLVRDMVHPAGIALYGRYRINRFIEEEDAQVIESSVFQQ